MLVRFVRDGNAAAPVGLAGAAIAPAIPTARRGLWRRRFSDVQQHVTEGMVERVREARQFLERSFWGHLPISAPWVSTRKALEAAVASEETRGLAAAAAAATDA